MPATVKNKEKNVNILKTSTCLTIHAGHPNQMKAIFVRIFAKFCCHVQNFFTTAGKIAFMNLDPFSAMLQICNKFL